MISKKYHSLSEQTVNQRNLAHGWRAEITSILQWIEDRSTLCTAAAIFLPGLSTFNYIRREHIPLSVTSSDLLAALPLVLAFISLVTVVFGANLLLPLSIMFKGAKRGEDGKLRLMPPKGLPRLKAVIRCFVTLSAPGLLIAIALFMDVATGSHHEWTIFVAIAMSTILFTMYIRRKIRRTNIESILTDSLPIALLAVLSQMVVTTITMQMALRLIGETSDLRVGCALVVATFLLAFFQVICAAVIEVTSSRTGSVTQACVGAAITITLACLVPATSAELAGNVIRVSMSEGGRCMQFRLDDMGKFAALRDGISTEQTIGIEVLANVDSAYLVRRYRNPDGVVYRIPADEVLELLSCPPSNKDSGSAKSNTTNTASNSKPRA